MKKYEPPNITEYGAVEEVTKAGSNKVGGKEDEYTGQTGLTGSDPTQ